MSRRPWRTRVGPLLLAVAALAGCSDGRSSPEPAASSTQLADDETDTVAPASPPEAAGLLVELVAVGGMCPAGECRSVTTVDRAGTWAVVAEDGGSRTGTLSEGLLADLTDEVEGTPPGALTVTPFTGECARDMDGTEWILTLLPGTGGEQRVSTCEHVIPDGPLLAVLAAVSEETAA